MNRRDFLRHAAAAVAAAAGGCIREYGEMLRLALTPRGHII